MEIEYSQEVRGKVFAYRFDTFEMKAIATSLKYEITKRTKKIEKIETDPDNDGQVTYTEAIRELRYEIKALNEIIKEFK